MRHLFLFLIFTTASLSQISNERQTIENGRIIITYDLQGDANDEYNITLFACNEQGNVANPVAVTGNTDVKAGIRRIIWWEPQLEGFVVAGWTVTLTPTKVLYSEKLGIEWVFVQGGPTGDFYISATEITFNQYDKFCEETSSKKPNDEFGRGNQPVINVSVIDAQEFCKWLGEKNKKIVSLPDEDEWEYAAKGGNKSKGYKYSGSNNINEVAWYMDNSKNKTHNVATKKKNELGIYDMSGNVGEWCGMSGAVRGGSWDQDNYSCQVLGREHYNAISRYPIGFRILQK
jgi:hypothetical protein